MALVVLLTLMLVTITNQTSQTWRYTANKVEQFSAAREAFEVVGRRLSQATLNTYWDYDDPKAPRHYVRQSDLRFLCGPTETLAGTSTPPRPTHGVFCQAPLGLTDNSQASTDPARDYRGLPSLLNTWGCFVEFGSDADLRPAFLTSNNPPLRYRFRLMELVMPSERLTIYSTDPAAAQANWHGWFAPALADSQRPVHVLAENIVALILLPKLSAVEEEARRHAGKQPLSPDYTYDSAGTKADPEVNPHHQLPPVVQVTMIALDEFSAARLAHGAGDQAPDLGARTLFQDSTKLEDDAGTVTPGDGDLATFQKKLTEARLTYRVFTSNVSIRGAKWSRASTN